MSEPPYEPPTEPPNVPPNVPPPPPPRNPGMVPPPPPPLQPPLLPPQPPKSYAGLIIGLAVVGVVLVAGILAIVLLAGSESDSDSEADEETSSSTEPTPEEMPSEPAGPVIQGDGYSYELPDEWQDISAEVVGTDPGGTLDSASAWGSSVATGRANVIVEVANDTGFTDLESAIAQLAENLETNLDATTTPVGNIIIDGEEAAGVTMTRTNDLKLEIVQTAYITLVGDAAYVITQSNESGDDEPQIAYDAIFGSWSWE